MEQEQRCFISAVLSKLAVLKQCTDRSSSLLFLFLVAAGHLRHANFPQALEK